MARIELACETVPQTIKEELRAHAAVDAETHDADPVKNAFIKRTLKLLWSRKFEAIRKSLLPEDEIRLPIDEKDHL
jgi:hypothetical protein